MPEIGCRVCAKTADIMLVSGVWVSHEALERLMASGEFRSIRAATPEVEIFAAYRSRH